MKSIAAASLSLTLILSAASAFGDELADRLAAVPNPRTADSTWVSDPAGVIANRRAEINRLITDLEQKTTTEMAVVVLPTIGSLVPKDFAVALVEKWGIGKRGKDNGVLVLHVLDQRRIEIETGYGMEGILPDVKCHWITEEIAVPFFKKNSFADGHYEMVRALVRGIEQPDISHGNLIAPFAAQPGANVDRVPDIPIRDSIALKYARLPERAFYSGWTPIVLIAIGGGIYFLFTLLYKSRSHGQDPHAKYSLYKSAGTRMQYAASIPAAASAYVAEYAQNGTFFAAVPTLLGVFFLTLWRRSNVLRALRDEPRKCGCGKTMHRLSESADDAYIEKGNVAEERIRSMDYDVWACECGQTRVESYEGKTPASKCPKCAYRTYKVTNTKTLRPATTSSTGLRETTCSCANCRYSKTDTSIIPKISTSSSSSGSSGRSGGSFGGGRSGGGGAGSSY